MTKLKLGPIHDDKPVKLTVELPKGVPLSRRARSNRAVLDVNINESGA